MQYTNFNTSYVVIKPGIQDRYFIEISNFNTSYVVIKRRTEILIARFRFNFNTSYVVIKHFKTLQRQSTCIISIHLMLLLNFTPGHIKSVHTKFQYILCCY